MMTQTLPNSKGPQTRHDQGGCLMYALYVAYETVLHPAGEIISTHRSPKSAYRALRRSREPSVHLAVGFCYHGERQGDQFGKEPPHEN